MSVPFSEYEKRFLLAEILKTSQIPPQSLLRVVREENIQPHWNEILVPIGRNVNACVAAFSELVNSPSTSFQRPTGLEPLIQNPKKRRHSDTDPITSTVRALKPKPAENGEQGGAFRSSSGNVPKKRGRPSKEELAQRQAEALARGEVYPPPKAAARRSTGAVAPIAPLILATAGPSEQALMPSPSSESTPAKKKRGRPTKEEAAAKANLESAEGREGSSGRSEEISRKVIDTLQRRHDNEEKFHDTIQEHPDLSRGVEIADSVTSSHTLLQQASGSI